MRNTILAAVASCALLAEPLRSAEAPVGEQPYLLVENGTVRCEIVLPEKAAPEVRAAAELLAETLKQITGAEIPRGPAATSPGSVRIHLGGKPEAPTVALDRDAFAIEPAGPRDLVLRGGGGLGTYYAVTEFLERYAGVLWVWPGATGTVLPRQATLRPTVRTQTSAPAFRARQFSGMEPAPMRLFRIHQEKSEIRTYFNHNTRRTMPGELFKTHPEYFAQANGKRHAAENRWQACTSNPEVVKIFTAAAKAHFRRAGDDVLSFSVAPNDGALEEFCQCEGCRALDVPGQEGISDRYCQFVNAVADGVGAEFPGKYIAWMAYGKPTRQPPVSVRPRENTLVYLVIPTLREPHADVKAWSGVAPHLGAYFHLHGKAVPKHYPRRMAEYLRFLHQHGVLGVYAEVYQQNAERRSSWELDGPRVWLLSKLLWDPSADTDELMNRFLTRFYGAAAPAMARYYAQCEAAWERRGNPFEFGRNHRDYELDLYTLADFAVLETALREAAKLAAHDETVLARLRAQQNALGKIASYYQWQPLPERFSVLPLKTPADARNLVREAGVRARAATERNPEAPLGLMPSAATVALESRFGEITALLGEAAPGFWKTARRDEPQLAPFIEPELARLAGEVAQVARNPGFEAAPAKRKAPAPGEAEWEELEAPGWSGWVQPNSPGRVALVRDNARSGKNSLAVQGAVSAGGVQQIPVAPGERYRISCWAKTDVPADAERTAPGGVLTVQWKSAAGKWHAKAVNAAAELPAGTRDWQKLSVAVVVPEGAARMVVMLGAQAQGAGGRTWFDDAAVERLYGGKPAP